MRRYTHKVEVPMDIPFGVNCFDPTSCKALVVRRGQGGQLQGRGPRGNRVQAGFDEYEEILSNGDLVS